MAGMAPAPATDSPVEPRLGSAGASIWLSSGLFSVAGATIHGAESIVEARTNVKKTKRRDGEPALYSYECNTAVAAQTPGVWISSVSRWSPGEPTQLSGMSGRTLMYVPARQHPAVPAGSRM